MKKTSVLCVLLLCTLYLCSCGAGNGNTLNPADSTGSQQLDFSSVITIVSSPSPVPSATPFYSPVPTPIPTYTPQPAPAVAAFPAAVSTPVPTPAPTPVPVVKYVTITKSPITETVNPGGTAVFTSYADNATSVNWILASGDRKTIYTLSDAPYYFPGLQVSGTGTNVVTLSNIPVTMNGWEVQCYFTGNGGPKYSADAYIYVNAVGGDAGAGASGSVLETAVQQNVQKCVSAVKTYSNLGYTVGDLENYSYSDQSGAASFNVRFTNASYTIIGEFIATATEYQPLTATVFDSAWASKSYSFINNASMLDFYQKVLMVYK